MALQSPESNLERRMMNWVNMVMQAPSMFNPEYPEDAPERYRALTTSMRHSCPGYGSYGFASNGSRYLVRGIVSAASCTFS